MFFPIHGGSGLLNKIGGILIALLVGSAPLSPLPAHAENLGLTLQILQGASSKSGIEDNTRLWFVIEPGSSKFRKIVVKSTANVAEKVTLSIGAVKRVNGESQLALGETSETEKWASFSEQNFILPARSEKEVQVGFEIPKSEGVNSYAAMLLVKATSAQGTNQNLAYSVPGAAQIAAPIFLGIGTEDEFLTKFEIKSVRGQITVKGKSLRVEIKNSGKTPVSVQGDVQAIGITFNTGTVGPFYYQTETIAPGETKFADALVGDSITESKWKIYVTATQGQVTESREFEVDVNYSGSRNYFANVIKIFTPLIFFILLFCSIRVLRTRKSTQASTPDMTSSKASFPDLSDEQIRQLIQEFVVTSGQSKPIKKASAKKAVAKKQAKKAVATKTTTRKPVKKVSKKAPVKKTTAARKAKR
jgi:hypothetical protein